MSTSTHAPSGRWALRLGRVAAVAVTLVLVPLFLFALKLDHWAGMSLEVEFLATFLGLGLATGVAALLLGQHKGFCIVPAIYVAVVLLLPLIDLSPAKPARRAVAGIEPGMDQAEVRAVIGRHFPESGRFRRPDIRTVHDGHWNIVLDPSDGHFNAALIELDFAEGRCLSARFSAD